MPYSISSIALRVLGQLARESYQAQGEGKRAHLLTGSKEILLWPFWESLMGCKGSDARSTLFTKLLRSHRGKSMDRTSCLPHTQPLTAVHEKLISWSKKETENFIWAKLKSTTWGVACQKLWELLRPLEVKTWLDKFVRLNEVFLTVYLVQI